MAERALEYAASEGRIETRIVRLHNVYGPLGTYDGGREKAPAALCRKVALLPRRATGTVEIWGDGRQTRSFCYIDDCVEGLYRVMFGDHAGPLNVGSDRLIAIDALAELVIEISGKRGIALVHVDGPQGVRGRNSDNALIRQVLGWEPSISLETGLVPTYRWIASLVGDG